MEDTLEREMSVRYERDNSINYAVIDAEKEWNCEGDYEVKMLMLNMPEHFLTLTMNEIDGKNCIYYDISSKQQLSKLFEYGKVTMEDVKQLFSNISEMVRVVDEYMLDLDRVILKPQHIYVSLANKKYSFMYSPVSGGADFYENMRSLFEYILERFDHSVEKASLVKFYEIYQRILVRDYTPHSLMDFFSDEDKPHIVSENKDIKDNEIQINDVQYDNKDDYDNYNYADSAYHNVSGMGHDVNSKSPDTRKMKNNIYKNSDNMRMNDNIHKKMYSSQMDDNIHKKSDSRRVNDNINEKKGAREINNNGLKGWDNKKNHDYNPKQNNWHSDRIIKDVMPERIDNESEKKTNKTAGFVMKVIAAVIVLNAVLSMFLREYAPVKLNTTVSMICIIAGLFIFYISGKVADIIGELTSENKVTEDELMPYRLHNNKSDEVSKKDYQCNTYEDSYADSIYNNNKPDNYVDRDRNIPELKNDRNISELKRYRNNISEIKYERENKVSEKTVYSNMVTAKVMKDEEEQKTMVNHTMLLSDYLKMLKDNKLTLNLLDNKDKQLYLKKGDTYEQPLESIELSKYPCTIGSLDGSADIFIDSPVISKMHACLLQEDDKFYIEDMNSTNGTYINDERIDMHNKTRIADGDILRVASYNFKVSIS